MKIHRRTTIAIWDWLAYCGGFAYVMVFFGRWMYKTTEAN